MSYVHSLRGKESGIDYPIEPRTICDADFGPVEVTYDYEAMKGKVTRESIEAGPLSLWRYKDLLPIEDVPRSGLNSGWTPLVKADRLAKHLGVKELYIKDDSANYPSFSYKDRVVAVAVTKAFEFGFDTVGCASTGNLAHSVSAHAAAAGLKACVMVPHDLEAGKMVGMNVFGPRVVRIEGNYDDVNRLCSQIADKYNWAIVNVNLRPFYTEGAKTHGFEIAEQMGWKLPQHTVVPVAGGTILPKIWKAYQEFITLGLVEANAPAMYGAQAQGCNPIVTALEEDAELFRPQKPKTIAKSIAIGNPADGYYVLKNIRESGGYGASASDPEILAAIKLLAEKEGIFTEPAGGTTMACAIKLIESGRIPKDESICVCITGNGLKTLEAMDGQFAESPAIPAKIADFDQLIQSTPGHAGSPACDAKPEATHV